MGLQHETPSTGSLRQGLSFRAAMVALRAGVKDSARMRAGIAERPNSLQCARNRKQDSTENVVQNLNQMIPPECGRNRKQANI